MSISGIAQSGLRASQARLTASASNVANANSVGPISAPATFGPAKGASEQPAAYRPIRTEQTAVAGGGTTTRYAPAGQPYTVRYQPDSLSADVHGMVAAPDVDLTQEAVEQLKAGQDFKASAKLIETDDTLARSTLEIWA